MGGMSPLNLHSSDAQEEDAEGSYPLRALGFATAVVGAVTIGLYIGRELRFRYKFRRRTPSDFFSNAGDPIAGTEYGMGV